MRLRNAILLVVLAAIAVLVGVQVTAQANDGGCHTVYNHRGYVSGEHDYAIFHEGDVTLTVETHGETIFVNPLRHHAGKRWEEVTKCKNPPPTTSTVPPITTTPTTTIPPSTTSTTQPPSTTSTTIVSTTSTLPPESTTSVPPTTTTEPPVTTTSSTTTTVVERTTTTDGVTTTTPPDEPEGELPMTGIELGWLAALAGGFLLLGGSALYATRRRDG